MAVCLDASLTETMNPKVSAGKIVASTRLTLKLLSTPTSISKIEETTA